MVIENINNVGNSLYFTHNAIAGVKYKLTYNVNGNNIFRICIKDGLKTKILNRAKAMQSGNQTTIYTAPANGAVYIEDVAALTNDKNYWTLIDNIILEEI